MIIDSSLAVLRLETLLEIFNGDRAEVQNVIDVLRKRTENWLAELERAVSAGDDKQIRAICHKIRGAAGTVTAERIEAAVTAIGDMAKQGRLEDIPEGVACLQKCIEEIKSFDINSSS